MSGSGVFKLLALTLLALSINGFSLPLFFDRLNILFGNALMYFCLEVLGFRYAFLMALVLSLERQLLYGNVVSSIFIPLELVSITLIRRVLHQNLIVSGWIFWVFAGLHIYIFAMTSLSGIDVATAFTPALKEAINGLISVTLGSLMVILYTRFYEREKNVSLLELVFVFFVGISITPMFLRSVYQAEIEERHIHREVKKDMNIVMKNIRESLNYWLDIHLGAVRELANRLVVWGGGNREQLQRETEAIRRSFNEFHACYIADPDATTITFYPEVNPKGKYMIGVNFSYRPYYKKVKETHKHTFTEVFVAKFALKPVVGIAVPAVKEGKFLGFAYCGLRLDRIKNIVEEFALKEGFYITLVDKKRRVIVSNMKGVKPFSKFRPGRFEVLEGGLILEVKEKEEKFLKTGMEKFFNSFFYKEDSLRKDTGWRVVMEVSVLPYMSSLFSKLNVNFVSIYIFSLISFILAKMFTHLSASPVRRLSETISTLEKGIDKNPDIRLPQTNIEEIRRLTQAFEDMAKKIFDYMEELRKIAYYDPLTELPNRALLKDRIESAISFSKRNDTKVAVLFIDLDYFKTVNDTLGHEVGDKILVQVANRLRGVFRETDTIARFGGDEFVAVIPNVKDVKDVMRVAERVLKIFNTPFDADGEDVYLSASIGIAMYPENGKDPTELIKNADIAMYKAKSEGKNNFAFFSEDLNRKAAEILVMKSKLHRALSNEEFLIHYQPIYSIEEGKVVGFEALLRWRDPEEGLVPPYKFIGLLEELGLIKEVGEWVLEKSFSVSKRWSELYGIYVSVNVSPRQFSDRDFVRKVLSTANRVGVDGENIVLEITEGSLIENPDESVNILKKLKAKKFRIAIDDFGTGYSSLAYLKKLPIDIIKVDMTFTQNMLHSNIDRSIVKAVIDLSHSMGLKSLAEGVESEEQLNLLRELGCELAQGYLFGRPMTEEDAEALIREQKGL